MSETLPQVIEQTNSLELAIAPEIALQHASHAAALLEQIILKNTTRRPLEFKGQRYLYVEHWQVIGQFYGCAVKTGEVEAVEIYEQKGFKAKASLVSATGIEISTAEAFCFPDEAQWKNKPLNQMASMAQTRAASKAYRNRFAWVAILAGYEPTPAEEVDGETQPQPAKIITPAGTVPPVNDALRFVIDITTEEGISGKTGKPWTRYDIYFKDDDRKYSTFSESICKTAGEAMAKKLPVVADVKSTQTGKYTNWSIESLTIAGSETKSEKLAKKFEEQELPI